MKTLRQNGFTLIELLVTMMIVAILMAIGIPSYRGFIAGQKVASVSQELHYSLMLARSEALKRGSSVTMAAPSNTWTSGWTLTASAATTILAHEGVTDVQISGPLSSVVYQGDGRLSAGTSAVFSVTTTASSAAQCVTINLSGSPVTKKGACS